MPRDQDIGELRAKRGKQIDGLKKARQEDLREKLQCAAYLNEIEKISKQLTAISNLLRRKANKTDAESNLTALEISAHKTRIAALKVKADINFRRLAKVLPDLKQIDLTDGDGNNPLSGLIDAIMRSAKSDD